MRPVFKKRAGSGRPVLALLVPDGVGVRNFILGKFLPLAGDRFEVHIFCGFPADLMPDEAAGHAVQEMPAYREGKVGGLLRYALQYAHMYRWRTPGMLRVLGEPRHHEWKSRLLHGTAKALGRAHASGQGIRFLEAKLHGIAGRHRLFRHYLETWERLRPEVVFCTHQRPSIVLPAILAARRLGIPTATFIFSWDNLSSKGRIAAPYEHFLVWSPLMKEEMQRFYPEVSEERIHVVGTPQFDPYADRQILMERGDFFRCIGADAERPLICYTGGDRSVCPQGPEQLASVMELIRSGAIHGNVQLIFRPVPTEDGRRYDGVRQHYPEMIYAQPAWRSRGEGEWFKFVPTSEDVRFLANLAHHSDVNINVASTVTLDFAIHDKPVVNLAYDMDGKLPFGMPIYEFHYLMDHYRPVVELGAARVARSPEELAAHVNAYLRDPSLDREGRRRLVELEVGVPVGQASARVVEALGRIAGVEAVA